jgi:hypothetical protein
MPQDPSEQLSPDLLESPEPIKSTLAQDEDPHSPEEELHTSEEHDAYPDHGDLWTQAIMLFANDNNNKPLTRPKKLLGDKNKLHPFVQILSIADLDACIALENAARPEGERCSREKVCFLSALCLA